MPYTVRRPGTDARQRLQSLVDDGTGMALDVGLIAAARRPRHELATAIDGDPSHACVRGGSSTCCPQQASIKLRRGQGVSNSDKGLPSQTSHPAHGHWGGRSADGPARGNAA